MAGVEVAVLQETLVLVLQLPPAAFGPPLPLPAFAPPRELLCEVRDLGRVLVPPPPSWAHTLPPSLASHQGLPPTERHLTRSLLEASLVFGALAATKGGWDARSWDARRWDATGAVAPVLVPPRYGPNPGLRP